MIRATGHIPGEWRSDGTGYWRQCSVRGKEIGRTEHTFQWVVDSRTVDRGNYEVREGSVCGNSDPQDKDLFGQNGMT